MVHSEKIGSKISLPRKLGRTTATLMTAAMMIGTGIFGTLGSSTAEAGSGILLAIMVSGFVILMTGISAAQLGVNYPDEGGAFVWARKFNHQTLGFVAGCGYLLKGIFSLGVMTLAFAVYAAQVFTGLPIPLVATGLIFLILALNLLKVDIAAKLLIGLMVVNVTLLSIFIVYAAPAVNPANLTNVLGSNGLLGVLAGAAIFFWTWDGFMRTAIIAGEIKKPRQTIPLAIVGGIALAAIVFLAIAATTLGVLGPVTMANGDVPILRAAVQAIGSWGSWIILASISIVIVSEPLGDMLAASRVAFAMGEAKELPSWLGKVQEGSNVPRNAVLTLALTVIALVWVLDLRQFLAIASMFTLVWYEVTNVSAMQLHREQRLTTPLFSWLGLAGCFALIISLPVWAITAGVAILLILAGLRRLRQSTWAHEAGVSSFGERH